MYQPEQFDAVHCKGRCPPRYHPLNDHSLLQVTFQNLTFCMSSVGVSLSDICNESENHLKKQNFQSLMHLQSSRRDDKGFEIKKPCCSPAAYRPLDILHLDQVGLDVDGVVVVVVVAVDVDVDNYAFWPLDILYRD